MFVEFPRKLCWGGGKVVLLLNDFSVVFTASLVGNFSPCTRQTIWGWRDIPGKCLSWFFGVAVFWLVHHNNLFTLRSVLFVTGRKRFVNWSRCAWNEKKQPKSSWENIFIFPTCRFRHALVFGFVHEWIGLNGSSCRKVCKFWAAVDIIRLTSYKTQLYWSWTLQTRTGLLLCQVFAVCLSSFYVLARERSHPIFSLCRQKIEDIDWTASTEPKTSMFWMKIVFQVSDKLCTSGPFQRQNKLLRLNNFLPNLAVAHLLWTTPWTRLVQLHSVIGHRCAKSTTFAVHQAIENNDTALPCSAERICSTVLFTSKLSSRNSRASQYHWQQSPKLSDTTWSIKGVCGAHRGSGTVGPSRLITHPAQRCIFAGRAQVDRETMSSKRQRLIGAQVQATTYQMRKPATLLDPLTEQDWSGRCVGLAISTQRWKELSVCKFLTLWKTKIRENCATQSHTQK